MKIFPTGTFAGGETLWNVDGEVRPESWLRARKILSARDQTTLADILQAQFVERAEEFRRRQAAAKAKPTPEPAAVPKKPQLRLAYSSG